MSYLQVVIGYRVNDDSREALPTLKISETSKLGERIFIRIHSRASSTCGKRAILYICSAFDTPTQSATACWVHPKK